MPEGLLVRILTIPPSVEPTHKGAGKHTAIGVYRHDRGDSCLPCVREGGARSVSEGLFEIPIHLNNPYFCRDRKLCFRQAFGNAENDNTGKNHGNRRIMLPRKLFL